MTETIVLGTGCFWCTEALFKMVPGVIKTEVGYSGGNVINPTYEQICTGNTGHAEVTRITFDTNILSLEKLLDVFWKIHDPTTINRQGNDVGTQYRSIILYNSEEQKQTAQNSKNNIEGAVTEIKKLSVFYPAENYHANYFAKNGSAPYCQFIISPKVKHLEELLTDAKST